MDYDWSKRPGFGSKMAFSKENKVKKDRELGMAEKRRKNSKK